MTEILTSLFGNLSDKAMNALSTDAVLKTYQANTTITNERQLCDFLFLVYQGHIQVYHLNEAGKQVTLYDVRDGGLCMKNLHCMLEAKPYHAEAKTITNATVLMIPKQTFNNVLANDASFMRTLLSATLNNLSQLRQHYEAMSFYPVKQRLLIYLNERSNHFSRRIIYRSHSDIAAEIGSSREVVSRQLKSLEKQGILTLARGKITLLKKPSV